MRLLNRYILQEILGYAGLSLGVFLFILMTPEVLRLSALLAQEHIALPQLFELFLSVLPKKLIWAIPLSVLTGLLLGMSRLAADSEIIALQAAGVGARRLLQPGLAFAFFGAALTLAATTWWGPLAARTMSELQAQLSAGQVSYEVRPRVFDERFPNRILYVQDTEQGGARWKGVFLADLTEPDNPRLTLARSAVAVPAAQSNQLRLHLFEGTAHSIVPGEPERYNVSTFAENDLAIPLPVSGAQLAVRRNADLSLGELWAASQNGEGWRNARADFHRRLALPAACLLFSLIALPLGLLAQQSGRAMGVVAAITVALSYYFVFLVGDRLAREGTLPPGLGVWLANLALLIPLFYFFHRHRWARPATSFAFTLKILAAVRRLSDSRPRFLRPQNPPGDGRAPVNSRLPRTLDLYVVRGVLFYFFLLLAALIALFALFTVLEMVDEIAANNISWSVVARFLWYLTPQALYLMAPLALLLGLLVELALMSKRNEVVAIKAAGISLYRIAVPVVLLGFVFSVSLFWLDNRYLPHANQQREALRNQIKGRPAQTFFQTDRRWIFGSRPRIYHYSLFDPDPALFARLNVYELDADSFSIRRRISARRAHWEPQLHAWVLEQGWVREFRQGRAASYHPFTVASFPELDEPPDYFRREIRESEQMNWQELRGYIAELRQSGFDITRLRVEWHKKFAFPLISTFIVLLAFPFGLTMGRRGAVGGLALGIGLGFGYWVLAGFFQALGNFALLPPLLAAWGPNIIFAFAGLYLILQVET